MEEIFGMKTLPSACVMIAAVNLQVYLSASQLSYRGWAYSLNCEADRWGWASRSDKWFFDETDHGEISEPEVYSLEFGPWGFALGP